MSRTELAALAAHLLLAAAVLALVLASTVAAQTPVTIPSDKVAEWQGYELVWRSYDGRARRATATLYGNANRHDADERPYTVVLVQGTGNPAPVTGDAVYLAEVVGRDLSVDPTRLAFLFRFATEGAERPLTVRATVRRSSSGGLTSPSWRVLSADEVEAYTDRQLR